MADEELWPGTDASAEAIQAFLPEKNLPDLGRGTGNAPGARPVQAEPSFDATSGFYIVSADDGVRNEFLSESELQRRSRFSRGVSRALGVQSLRGPVTAVLLLVLLLVRGTEYSAPVVSVAIPVGTTDRSGAASESDRAAAAAPVDIALGDSPDAREGDLRMRPPDEFDDLPAAGEPGAERLPLQSALSAPQAVGRMASTGVETAVASPAPPRAIRPIAIDVRRAEAARDDGLRELESTGQPIDERVAVISAAPVALTALAPAVAVLPEPVATPAVIRDPAPPEAGGGASATVGGAVPWRDLLSGYRTAYESLDARLAKQVWPAVDERALARAFDGLESQAVTFDTCSVSPGDDRVVASCRGTATYVTRMGRRTSHTERRQWTFQLEKSGPGWVIESVEVR